MDRRSLNILATVSRGNFGCIVNGQLSTDPNDPIGGTKGVTMKMYIGKSGGFMWSLCKLVGV